MRRRSRSRTARRFVAALPLALGFPLRCGALARARFAASVRRSRSRSVRRFAVAALPLALGSPLGAALPLTLGSPLRCGFPFCGALAHARFADWGGALAHARLAACGGGFRRRKRLFVRPFGRRSRSRPVRRFGRRSRSRSAFRFGRRSLSARFAASVWRSRSRSARRVVAALPLAPGSPLCSCGAPARARFAALRRSRSARLAALRLRRSRSRSGGFYLINIYLNIIINQSRRRREAPAFRTAKKYAPFGGVFPLSDIYFCFAYSAIALYFSKSSGRRMRALAGLVEGSSMHGMQPQGSQNRL